MNIARIATRKRNRRLAVTPEGRELLEGTGRGFVTKSMVRKVSKVFRSSYNDATHFINKQDANTLRKVLGWG